MKTITAIYGCDYCDFRSSNLEEIRKHEANCMLNPNNTEARSSLITKMKESTTLSELNDLLNSAIARDIIPEPSIEDGDYHRHYGNSLDYNFSINRYSLANRYKGHFEIFGVPTEIEEYPKLNELVQEMKEINKTSSEYNSVFNKHRKQTLKVAKEESSEFLNAKEDLDKILEEIKDFERKRLRLNKIYDDVVKTLDDKIVQEYGYIDPNIRLNEIKQALN